MSGCERKYNIRIPVSVILFITHSHHTGNPKAPRPSRSPGKPPQTLLHFLGFGAAGFLTAVAGLTGRTPCAAEAVADLGAGDGAVAFGFSTSGLPFTLPLNEAAGLKAGVCGFGTAKQHNIDG